MELVKLVDGKLVKVSEKERQKLVITNPSEKILKVALNYKDPVYEEQPEYDFETEYLKEEYIETEDKIIITYIVEKIAEEDHITSNDTIEEFTKELETEAEEESAE